MALWRKKRTVNRLPRKGGAVAPCLKAAMSQSVRAVLNASHDPESVLETLRSNVECGCFFTAQVMLNGLEEALSRRRENAVNFGVMCALMTSMTLGLALDMPDIEHSNDDRWSGAREQLVTAYMVLMAASTYLSLVGVILSLVYVEQMATFMQDAEDQLWYGSTIPFEPIVQMVVWSSITLGIGLAAGLLVVNGGVAADIACGIFAVVFSVFMVYWFTCLFLNCRRRRRTLQKLRESFLAALPPSLDEEQ